MGYARYEVFRRGQTIEAGYDVATTCEQPSCNETIDRGLAHLCGETPGDDEHGCGGYFCDQHLYMAPEGQHGERCILDRDNGADPTRHSPDAMVVTFNGAPARRDPRRAHTSRSSSMESIQAGQVWKSRYGAAHVAVTQIDGISIRLATVTVEDDVVRPYGCERWATVGQLSKAYRLTGLVITDEEQ
ncbi:hypothetical protein V2E29_04630 [Streptomyces diastatochromogenes]|uniref:hypothetical protein n=1 Tax=Streptomyces diastatochromogenes TaxID=42236 RepID=UPI002F264B58